jgi:hypothetical protein
MFEEEVKTMFEKRFCPYCGAPLTDGCDCERELAEYEADLIEELEDRQLTTAWQQDLIDLYRYER